MAMGSLTRRNFVIAGAALGGAARGATRAFAQAAPPAASHPLDPLLATEIASLKSIVRAQAALTPRTIFPWVQLNEPPKSEVLAFRPGSSFRREALVVAVSPEQRTAFEMIVDLRARKLASKTNLENLQPFLSVDEHMAAAEVVDASSEVKAALERRGYAIPGKISDRFFIDTYAPGGDPAIAGAGQPVRLVRILFADRQGGANNYGPYVEGLMVLVDVYGGTVRRVFDYPGAIANRHVPADIFSRQVLGPQRAAVDLAISPQTDAGAVVDGNHVRWQGWDFRYSFNQREGLVLYQIAYDDGGSLRSICYRAAVSEMLVPYADPSPGWVWREFFDVGEYGLGAFSEELRPGKELPNNAFVRDVVLASTALEASVDPGRVFFYERDNGALLGHVQDDPERRVYARAKDLVAGFLAVVGNYDYMFEWIFHQDGSFEFRAELLGLSLNKTIAGVSCGACEAEARGGPGVYDAPLDQAYGSLVSAQMLGVTHQHWVNLRLDFDIDGQANAVEEYNVVPAPADAASNRAGRALTVKRTVFGTSREAVRLLNESTNRSWVVYNPARRSQIGQFAGYEIDALANSFSSIPESRYGEPTSFVQRHLWVTQYDERQLYAAGWYPNQQPADYADDLFHYADGKSVYDRDVVVWYSLGFTHVTRPEDFPIMPRETIGVSFKPWGFFSKNPAMGYARLDEGS
jgi:primary-amine oxidase